MITANAIIDHYASYTGWNQNSKEAIATQFIDSGEEDFESFVRNRAKRELPESQLPARLDFLNRNK